MLDSSFLQALRECVDPTRLLTDPADCWSYGYDNSKMHRCPEAVVFPLSTDEVESLVKLCNQTKTAIFPRGRASGTTGGSVPTMSGIVVSLEKMIQLKQLSSTDRFLVAEAGATNQSVQDYAKSKNLFWAPDPTSSAYCSIGGNIAVNAAGPRAFKYGSCRENILGLTVICGNGTRLQTGGTFSKSATGYDLTRLFIGNEGTLAIITEATLKLLPLPESEMHFAFYYTDRFAAAVTVQRIFELGLTPSALEFIDATGLSLIQKYQADLIPTNSQSLLLIKIDGYPASLAHEAKVWETLADQTGCSHFEKSDSTHTQDQLWRARKALSPLLRNLTDGKINEDIVVPVSKLCEFLKFIDDLREQKKLLIVCFGHIGNGNLHVNLLYDQKNSTEKQTAEGTLRELFNKVLALGGQISGEHGIGLMKKSFLKPALGESQLGMMKSIKTIFDPNGILNPLKLF